MKMKSLTIGQLASAVNRDCLSFSYYWAWGFLKETIDLWRCPANQELLCDDARIMVRQILGNGGRGDNLPAL